MTASRNLFNPHGSFTIDVTSNRLTVNAKGPFNLESVQEFQCELEKAMLRLDSKDWTHVIVLHGMSMLTPEAEKQLEQVVLKRKSRGMFACAAVIVDTEGKNLVKQQLTRVYNNTKTIFNFFDSLDEANQWLDEEQQKKDLA